MNKSELKLLVPSQQLGHKLRNGKKKIQYINRGSERVEGQN